MKELRNLFANILKFYVILQKKSLKNNCHISYVLLVDLIVWTYIIIYYHFIDAFVNVNLLPSQLSKNLFTCLKDILIESPANLGIWKKKMMTLLLKVKVL